MTALLLHAVTTSDSADQRRPLAGGARAIAYRDLSAIVTEQEKFSFDEIDNTKISEHRGIVDALFKTQVVLPTPVGLIFRNDEVLTRWMELHYVSLTDGLSFVHERVGARVHVSRPNAPKGQAEAGTDLAELATEIFRDLRRIAVASVSISTEQVTGIAVSAAFLVERERWKEFARAAFEGQKVNESLAVETTGPWAPYDFVRMQFTD